MTGLASGFRVGSFLARCDGVTRATCDQTTLSYFLGDQPMSSSRAAVEPAAAVGAAARPIIYLGMDVHKDSITIAVLPEGAKAPTRVDLLTNDLPTLKRWLERVAREGELRACYEASGAGYVLHRAITEPPRDCRGLPTVRGWEHDESDAVFS
jgi:hypothetical protein